MSSVTESVSTTLRRVRAVDSYKNMKAWPYKADETLELSTDRFTYQSHDITAVRVAGREDVSR
jgi:hypothetical protein